MLSSQDSLREEEVDNEQDRCSSVRQNLCCRFQADVVRLTGPSNAYYRSNDSTHAGSLHSRYSTSFLVKSRGHKYLPKMRALKMNFRPLDLLRLKMNKCIAAPSMNRTKMTALIGTSGMIDGWPPRPLNCGVSRLEAVAVCCSRPCNQLQLFIVLVEVVILSLTSKVPGKCIFLLVMTVVETLTL